MNSNRGGFSLPTGRGRQGSATGRVHGARRNPEGQIDASMELFALGHHSRQRPGERNLVTDPPAPAQVPIHLEESVAITIVCEQLTSRTISVRAPKSLSPAICANALEQMFGTVSPLVMMFSSPLNRHSPIWTDNEQENQAAFELAIENENQIQAAGKFNELIDCLCCD